MLSNTPLLELALLRANNDILGALDCKSSVVLVLLDLTAAFDTLDHAILTSRLQHVVSLQGAVLIGSLHISPIELFQ